MSLLARWREWRYRRACERFRGLMSFYGFDVSGVSDEELEDALWLVGKALSGTGCSTEEAAAAFGVLAGCGRPG